jgi:hypothetical protein
MLCLTYAAKLSRISAFFSSAISALKRQSGYSTQLNYPYVSA